MEPRSRRDDFLKSLSTVEENIEVLKQRFGKVSSDINDLHQNLSPGHEAQAVGNLVELSSELSATIQEIGLAQASVRVQKVMIKPIRLSYGVAVEIARVNRMDWMNQRMALVDQWRLVGYNANKLLAVLNIELEGSTATVGNNPVRFQGSTTNLQGSINFQAPLNRKTARNLYRESLIDYQRIKRAYSLYVDRTVFNIRSNLRLLWRLEQNLEIQRRALAIAIRRVDKTLEDSNRPARPTVPGQPPTQFGPTLSQNLLLAMSDLRNIQDNFMSVWVNHEAARITLLFQLGLLDAKPDGTFTDFPLDDASYTEMTEESRDPSEKLPPGTAYVDQIDKAVMDGDDIGSVLAKNPDDELILKVETTTGETISKADLEAVERWEQIREQAELPQKNGRSEMSLLTR